jgi:ABC-type multidrug transport system ATPase subunit
MRLLRNALLQVLDEARAALDSADAAEVWEAVAATRTPRGAA